MSYNGSGTFAINTAGQPVVSGTTITSTAFNLLTADLATGLSTAICKDGQTTTTASIPFALGIGVGAANAFAVSSAGTITSTSTSTQTIEGPVDLSAATAGQIIFPATQNASAGANTLDDYEEGTWTPANANVTITVNSASYTKIGNRVYADFDVTWPATADTNNASISGLTYSAAARNQGCAIASTNRATYVSALVASGADRIDLYAGGGILSNANVSTNRFIGTAIYSV